MANRKGKAFPQGERQSRARNLARKTRSRPFVTQIDWFNLELRPSDKSGIFWTCHLPSKKLAEEAMMLPTESRARLADLLVESLDAADLTQLDQLWIAEAKRRRDEVFTGDTDTVSGEEALRSVRDSLWR